MFGKVLNMNLLPLLTAMMTVESGGDDTKINRKEQAYGCLQIRQPVIDDVNSEIFHFRQGNIVNVPTCMLPLHYVSLEQVLERHCAINVAEVYLTRWGDIYKRRTNKEPTYEVYVRIWVGGPDGWIRESTLKYWNKVKAELKKNGEEI